MSNQYTKLILLAILINGSLTYSYYGRLVGITNNSPYKVTVQTSEGTNTSSVTLNNGRPANNIANREFDLREIYPNGSMNLAFPWVNWQGDKTIHVRVYDNKGIIISQVDLTDRNGHLWIHDYTHNKDLASIDKYVCLVYEAAGFVHDCSNPNSSYEEIKHDFNITITVDPTGVITSAGIATS